MKLGDPLPPLDGATLWINGQATADSLAHRAVLVHIWSTSCPLCSEGVHAIARWRTACDAAALACVAICTLRPDDALDVASFEREARTKMHITYPCALDGTGLIAERFGNPYAPAYFVFDRSHALRHRQEGNASLASVDAILRNAAS
jgi:hypothetical protein